MEIKVKNEITIEFGDQKFEIDQAEAVFLYEKLKTILGRVDSPIQPFIPYNPSPTYPTVPDVWYSTQTNPPVNLCQNNSQSVNTPYPYDLKQNDF